jgi:hypothetical protein
VLVLMQGRLVSDVSVSELQTGTRFEIELAGPKSECEQMLAGLPLVTSVELSSSTGEWHTYAVIGGDELARELAAKQCLRFGWRLRELRSVAGTLEDHFVRLTVRGRKEAA